MPPSSPAPPGDRSRSAGPRSTAEGRCGEAIDWRKHAAIMAAILAIVGAATILWGERIAINQGQGWDGQAYMEWAQDFWHRVVVDGLTRYHAQRVLPSAVVALLGNAIGLAPQIPHYIVVFAELDLVLLVVSAILWAHLALRVLRVSTSATWAGFLALFGCFANARHALYYPVLTDVTAFTLGMALAWSYLARKPVVVWLVALLATWTWPALPPIAMLMLIFPRPKAETATASGTATATASATDTAAAADAARRLPRLAAAALAAAGALAFIGVAWYVLARAPTRAGLARYVTGLRVRAVAIAVAGCALILAVKTVWLAAVGVHGEGPTTAQFFCEHTIAALRGPLWGPVHHVAYFGPIVLVALLAWRRIAATADAWGPAFVIALALVVAFAAGSNSRQWNHLFPLLVAATIAATSPMWTPARVGWFALASAAWSKAWLHIGYDHNSGWHTFPQDRYFMNHGPYASDLTWAIHLGAAAVTTVAIVTIARRGADSGAQH